MPMTWRETGLAKIARHVMGCHRDGSNALDAVAGNIYARA